MTFRITLERLPLRLDFEVGSIAEGVAALQEQDTQLHKFLAIADTMASEAGNEAPEAGAEPVKKPRGRPAKANQPDPSTATAPPPLAIPPVLATSSQPTVPLAPAADGGIPPFLQRAPEVAAPPPPPAPPAPVTPPSGILAGKVIGELDRRGTDDANKKMLADWLAACGLTAAGASYDEAVSVVRLTTDEKLVTIAGHLGVS